MPRISAFYGIAIYMYWNEGHHARPHFHARYGGQTASVDFDGNLIAGSLPPRALTLVTEWAALHRHELEETGRVLATAASSSRPTRSRSISRVDELVDITAVEVLADHTVRLTFADGTVGDADLTDHDWPGVLEPLRDPAYFAEVRVDPESGTVAWPNGIDLAPEPLYEEAKRNPIKAASAHSSG